MLVKIITIISLLAVKEILAHPQKQQQQQQQQQQPQEKQSRFTKDDVNHNKKPETTEKQMQLAAPQILDNPSYDPNLYSTFIPQDAVQQYVSSYGGPFAPAAYIPTFTVQSGYEGYLVPDTQSSSEIIPYPGFYKAISDLIPGNAFTWMTQSAAIILTIVGVVFLGGAITSALCNFTQLCSISFTSLPFLKLKTAAESISRAFDSDFLSPEVIERMAEFLKDAIEKYSQMQESEMNNK